MIETQQKMSNGVNQNFEGSKNGIIAERERLLSPVHLQANQTSDIRHQTSDIRHQTSDIRHQTSDIRH